MNQEQQSAFLSNCLLNAIAAGEVSYSVAIVAALNSVLSLIVAKADNNKIAAWALFDMCIAAMEAGMVAQRGPRTGPSMN